MTIEKNGKVYAVFESSDAWGLTLENGKLRVHFKVSKDLCPTAVTLQEYVLGNDELF
jgi:hypothetical protein